MRSRAFLSTEAECRCDTFAQGGNRRGCQGPTVICEGISEPTRCFSKTNRTEACTVRTPLGQPRTRAISAEPMGRGAEWLWKNLPCLMGKVIIWETRRGLYNDPATCVRGAGPSVLTPQRRVSTVKEDEGLSAQPASTLVSFWLLPLLSAESALRAEIRNLRINPLPSSLGPALQRLLADILFSFIYCHLVYIWNYLLTKHTIWFYYLISELFKNSKSRGNSLSCGEILELLSTSWKTLDVTNKLLTHTLKWSRLFLLSKISVFSRRKYPEGVMFPVKFFAS